MKRLGKMALAVCLCILFLAGCGEARVPDVVEAPTVAVSREGEIRVWQVGDFDKSYYNVAELNNMASEEAKDYNATLGREAVAVEKTEALEGSGKVVVSYRFDGWESCGAFCESSIFYGTMKEAVQNGFYSNDAVKELVMKNVKDGTAYDGEISQETKSCLIVTDMKANIYCPGKVTYISEGAVVNADGSVSSFEAEGPVYILLK